MQLFIVPYGNNYTIAKVEAPRITLTRDQLFVTSSAWLTEGKSRHRNKFIDQRQRRISISRFLFFPMPLAKKLNDLFMLSTSGTSVAHLHSVCFFFLFFFFKCMDQGNLAIRLQQVNSRYAGYIETWIIS